MLYVTHSPAEAIALGSRLFLLEAGRIVAEGSSARRPVEAPHNHHWPRARGETFETFSPPAWSKIAPTEGRQRSRARRRPALFVPFLDRPTARPSSSPSAPTTSCFATGPLSGLSARNQIPGVVERIVHHGPEAEVIVRTGKITWIVSVVDPALEQLGLAPGAPIHLIIKARSCQILDSGSDRS